MPLSKSKGHPLHNSIEETLIEVGLIHEVDTPDGTMISLVYDELSEKRRALYLVEDLFLEIIKTQLAKTGITSFDAPVIRTQQDTLPQIGQFAWDFAGPSYLMGLRHIKKDSTPSPAFIAGDIRTPHLCSADKAGKTGGYTHCPREL